MKNTVVCSIEDIDERLHHHLLQCHLECDEENSEEDFDVYQTVGFDTNSDKFKIDGHEYLFEELDFNGIKYIVYICLEGFSNEEKVKSMMTKFFDPEVYNIDFDAIDNTWNNYNHEINVVAYRSRSKYGTSYFYGIYKFVGKLIPSNT